VPGRLSTMYLEDTAKQIRQVLILRQEGGFKMPMILTSIDRYGSVMLAEYTAVPGKKDHWNCEIIAERMKRDSMKRPSICCLWTLVAKRIASCSMLRESHGFCIDDHKKRQTG
jgi:hypothetical protein